MCASLVTLSLAPFKLFKNISKSGTYWDKAGGCLRGSWVAGALKGQAQYDQPHYHFEGQFAKGLPAGVCYLFVWNRQWQRLTR